MELGIRGKTALVVGASRGLGADICRALASEGVRVMAAARTLDELRQLQADLEELHAAAHVVAAVDLLSDGGVAELLATVEATIGVPDIIIHNLGGTLGVRECFASAEAYRQVWQLNLGIAVDINAQLVPQLEKRGWGRIIHVSSSAAVKVDASLAYCSAKAALNAYVVGLGRMVAASGVVACAVLPGPFQYPGSQWAQRETQQPDAYRQFVAVRMPLGRLGTPDDITGIILFLASQHSGFFAGALVPVDGGMK